MGATKQLMMETEELRQVALGVLCAAGALKECEWHGGTYMGGNGDVDAAYRMANSRITASEITLPDGFSRRDFTDMIKEYGEMYWPDSCGFCDKR